DNAAIAGLTAPQFGLGALALLDLLLEAFVCLAQHGGTLTGEGFKLLLHVAQRLLDLPLPGHVHSDGNAADDLAAVVAQRLDSCVELAALLPVSVKLRMPGERAQVSAERRLVRVIQFEDIL